MAHLLAPQPSAPTLPVFFNVDGVVGAAPATNKREDVLFVQFCLFAIADAQVATTEPELVAAAKAVHITGNIDAATINAIRVFQEVLKKGGSLSKVVDGRVSPAKGGYSYPNANWIIVNLNDALQTRNVNVWPRIDKIPGCPPELMQMVTRTVAGT